MTERRFYVDPIDVGPESLTLRESEAQHARRVLRLAPGDAVTCFDGRGRAWRGTIAEYAGRAAFVAIEGELPARTPDRPEITLAQGLVKNDAMDAIVQRATELGVVRLVPLRSERADARDVERRRERWTRVALEAAKQCESNVVPELAPPTSVADALADAGASAVVCRERAERPNALERFARLERATVFVGPEGGWSPDETELFERAGAIELSLGSTILRADTAAVAAVAVVRFAASLRT